MQRILFSLDAVYSGNAVLKIVSDPKPWDVYKRQGEYGAEDAYFIVNTAFNYEIAKGTILQFGINNLFDKEFYASDATSGRTYNVSLRYSF